MKGQSATKRKGDLTMILLGRRWFDPAAATALGLAVGWIPKSSLLAIGMAIAALFARVPLPLMLTVAVIAGCTSSWFDARLDGLGRSLLEAEMLQPIWHEMASLPIFPWLEWNNSVVLGSFVAAVVCFLPMLIVGLLFHRDRVRQIRKSRLAGENSLRLSAFENAKVRKKTIVQEKTTSETVETEIIKTVSESKSTITDDLRMPEPEASEIVQSQPLVAEASTVNRSRSSRKRAPSDRRVAIDTDEAMNRPNLIDATSTPKTKPMVSVEAAIAEETAFLQETVIEIVRYRPKELPPPRGKIKAPLTNRSEKKSSLESNESLEPMQRQLNESIHPSGEMTIHAHPAMLPQEVSEKPIDTALAADRPREEALRYLLWHLSGVKRPSTQALQERPS